MPFRGSSSPAGRACARAAARARCSSRGSSWSTSARCCGLDYRFANPDDGPAFFSLCIVALPLIFFVVWLEVAFGPPFWVHLLTSVPLMLAGCLLPLRPIKGWLVASQWVNKSQEAGTEGLWSKLHGDERE